ncbi:MAG: thiol:disulfide interchange protein DsbA/DsbL [Gammaproteobacteria bacterium]|nr:thiol:disulfide interchange protein DsbA/DsbL [Gammaproteobacteria bacterium]
MNKFAVRITGLLAMLTLAMGAHAQSGYEAVSPPVPTEVSEGVEVLEFFWYGCPHCYALHPHIDAWAVRKPANVKFRLVAAPLNSSWTMHSRAYYAAEVLDVLDRFHEPFFDVIHKGRKNMRKEDEVVAFAASLGIDGNAFRDAMNSFATETRLRRALQLADAYRISGVPTVTVNGKYKTSGQLAGGHPQMIKVMEKLIADEGGS